MKRCFLRMFAIFSIFLLVIPLINIKYIYAASLKDDAVAYREKGYEAQERGDLDTAITWYQKATNLDVNYAAPHNDLGILFEAKGWLDRAESEYQKALVLDPEYAKAHTNLALLYERKGELEKAAFHWMRRHRIGRPGDYWTMEAAQRLEKLGLVDKLEEKVKTKRTVKEQDAIKEIELREIEKADEWTRLGGDTNKKKPLVDKKICEKKPKKPKIKIREYEKKKKKKEARKKPDEWTRLGDSAEKKESLAAEKISEEKQEKPQGKISKSEEIKKTPKEKPKAKVKPKKTKKKEEAKKKTDEWTKVGFMSKKEKTITSSSAMDKELEESLRIAEQVLRQKKGKSAAEPPKIKMQEVAADEKSESLPVKYTSSSGAKSCYAKAEDYYKKGEYVRALEEIRVGKKEYPDYENLLRLEQTVKNKMKEERIEDHYNEGIMRYRQDDYSGAKKEFKAILNILPE